MWKYKLGTVVRAKHDENKWGHIVGFALNDLDETILSIMWINDGENRDEDIIHPHNLVFEWDDLSGE